MAVLDALWMSCGGWSMTKLEDQNLEEIRKEWLYPFDEDKAFGNLNRSAKRLIENIEDAYQKQDPRLGDLYLVLRKQVRTYSGSNQIADVDLFCAIYDFRQGRLAEAAQRLTNAHALFRQGNEDHQHAVVGWMLGVVSWARGGVDHRAAAMFYWQNCYDYFQERAQEVSSKPEQTRWYLERVKEIDDFFATITVI
jgi:hypothetical protein